MKKKSNPKKRKNDEQKRVPGGPGSGPQQMPGRNQEAHRVPNTNPTTDYNRNWEGEEDEDTRERRPA